MAAPTTCTGAAGAAEGLTRGKRYATPLVAGAYSYYVGSGGTGGSGTSGGYGGTIGSAGGNTIWNYGGAEDVDAGGGGGGGNGSYGDPGVAGLVLAGTGYSGGAGGFGRSAGSVTDGAGGGGSGGPSGPGGVGGTGGIGSGGTAGIGYGPGGAGGTNNGFNGGLPGGGGGGGGSGYLSNNSALGGQGANGEIVITYTQQAVPEPTTLALLATGIVALLAFACRGRCRRFAISITAIAFLPASLAKADVFNMPSGQTSLQFVTVGDAGNKADLLTGGTLGSVGYTFQMGKYDVTFGQYTAFLNAVAASDPYGLYNSSMGTLFSTQGISRSGSSGSYSYSVTGSAPGAANMPILRTTWGDAARFCNWLQNGQPTSGTEGNATTETGAYQLSGATSNAALLAVAAPAHSGTGAAQFFIPTENEWYKAAYYKSGGTNAGYWIYPMQSNTAPDNSLALALSESNDANFLTNSGYTDPIYYLTPVGTFAASPGPYGTFDIGGDSYQWNETNYSNTYRGVSGGPYYLGSNFLTSYIGTIGSGPSVNGYGFRVASSVVVPEPSTLVLLGAGAIGLLGFAWR